MRWFLRRLGFYVFATWVALTITFLLPRLMPGDPIFTTFPDNVLSFTKICPGGKSGA